MFNAFSVFKMTDQANRINKFRQKTTVLAEIVFLPATSVAWLHMFFVAQFDKLKLVHSFSKSPTKKLSARSQVFPFAIVTSINF